MATRSETTLFQDLNQVKRILKEQGYDEPERVSALWRHKKNPKHFVRIISYSNGYVIQKGEDTNV